MEIKYIESAAMLCNKQTAIGPGLFLNYHKKMTVFGGAFTELKL